jgi:hypothetical protein
MMKKTKTAFTGGDKNEENKTVQVVLARIKKARVDAKRKATNDRKQGVEAKTDDNDASKCGFEFCNEFGTAKCARCHIVKYCSK